MSMGETPKNQQELWVATQDIPKSPGHPFYQKLNRVLAEAGFDRKIQEWCEPYYAKAGRPSIPPGVYFRMLLIGYFEGIDSQRGIAWRCRDSLSLKEFLGFAVSESTPDHSSLTYIRKRLPLEVHHRVFLLVLEIAREKKLLRGKSVAVDSTTLEANAAMKSIVRKETGEDWKEYLTRLAKEEGIEEPRDEDLRRFDRKRTDKKVSNQEWESKTDPDSRITKMKDGRTHLAYKAEHAVEDQQSYYANRRRVKGKRGRMLQRKRSEMTERSFAHVCETGGGRRTWLRGLENIHKRYLIQVAARNLGLILRHLFGVGTPRSLQREGIAPFWFFSALRAAMDSLRRKWLPELSLAVRSGNLFTIRTQFELWAAKQ